MNKIKYFGKLAFAGLFSLLTSCINDSFKEMESGLLGQPNYETGVFTASVSVSNVKEKAIQTNGLNGYLLGQYTQEPFGTKKANIIAQVVLANVNPSFGATSQANEDAKNKSEKETATQAYLYIPFFSRNQPLTNSYQQDTKYELDSIYGSKEASFNLKINELTYFLRDIDNDLKPQIYYSDLDITGHLGASLNSSTTTYSINNESIKRYNFDNPDTADDESKTIHDVLAPGIRIPLETAFFQTKILDKEGADELANLNAFKNYFRGISIFADNFSKDLMMLLDMSKAKIEIVYTYESEHNGQTKKHQNRFEMNLNGITINLYDNSGENIPDQPDPKNVERVFLSGAEGGVAHFSLFTEAELAQIRQKNSLITDASLYLYVDQSVTYKKEPQRVYIYNTKTGAILQDYTLDPTLILSSEASNSVVKHLGKLQKVDGKGLYYRIRITNHVINVVKNKTENVPLGVAVASNVKNVAVMNYLNASNVKKSIPATTLTTPLSTIIYGNSANIDPKKQLKLVINYTKSK